MKKIVFTVLCVLVLSFAAMAQYTGPTGTVTTVKEALNMPDHTPVILTGKIEKYLGDEMYRFSDETGTIDVEIDEDIWRYFSVSAEDTVVITGEVDKDFMTRTIEVNQISKKQA